MPIQKWYQEIKMTRMCEHRQIQGEASFEGLSPVHTNPFSNEKGAVLLRFQKNLRPHLTFSYRFRPSTLQRRSREKPHGSVCSPFWILTMERSGHLSCLFDDVTVFRHERTQVICTGSTLSRGDFCFRVFCG